VFKVDLSNRTIFVTGALGAIAEHILCRLAETGATLVLTDIKDDAEATEILQQWNIEAESYKYYQMDVTDSQAVNCVVGDAMKKFPNLDTVLGHAGGCSLHPFFDTSKEEFDRIFRFNYLAQTYLARAVVSSWRQQAVAGHLIFTSSYVARFPHTRIPAYATAKAALEHFARCLALECSPFGVRVNAISPGNVAAGSSLKVFDEDPEYRDLVMRVSPLGRRNSPEAVADAFLFLCSPLAREVNGHILSVDMGVGIPKIG